MIRRGTEIALSKVENFKGGTGALLSREILMPEEMGGHGRKFGFTTLEPGASIGTHAHEGDSETYYILKGSARYNDNGTWVDVKEGDMMHCRDGESHGIENSDDGPLQFIALILYSERKER
ncbi:MAG: cupin domain-containing protein [Pyramidobacter sp.]|nr:cupin domain-containing protein [Pyramidobacter sp.]